MNLAEVLRNMHGKADPEKYGPEVQSYLHSRIVQQFNKLRKGGTDRDVTWSYFKNPWYTRKDGTQVPIWGGVPRADGNGMVKGKKRSKNPEGKKRYTKNSALMQSTGVMKAALISDMRISAMGIKLITPTPYAPFQNALRNFHYITDSEAEMIAGFVSRRMG